MLIFSQIHSNQLMSSPPMIATMLDPRHKHLSFLTPAQRLDAKAKLVELGEAVEVATPIPQAEEGDVDAPEGDAAPQPVALRPASAMALLLGGQYAAAAPAAASMDTEVDNFLRDIPAQLETNPTDWWKINAARFPRLATLARQYLCIPATSVPSERVFSAAGLLVTRLRSRLTPEHVDQLLFLNKYKYKHKKIVIETV